MIDMLNKIIQKMLAEPLINGIYPSMVAAILGIFGLVIVVCCANKCILYGTCNPRTSIGKTVYLGGWALKAFGAGFLAVSVLALCTSVFIVTASTAFMLLSWSIFTCVAASLLSSMITASICLYILYRIW
jgi:hypothetical protein